MINEIKHGFIRGYSAPMASSVLVSARALLLTSEVIMRYKKEVVTFISGAMAVILLGYLSYNAMSTREVEVIKKEIVYEDRVVKVPIQVPKYVTKTITDTITQFVPLYLSINKTEFGQVFNYYRQERGACSTFDWNGELYHTRYATESKDICSPKIQ